MCTVTFIPLNDRIILSSSRDEKVMRKPALKPYKYSFNDVSLIYPKDGEAGGTWIAMKDNSDAAVLLNGAFIKHISLPPYAISRGIVFLAIVQSANPLEYFNTTSLFNIEPFTIVLWQNEQLYECRWDGLKKHWQAMNPCKPHIWSSATLYSEDVIIKRELWFAKWVNKTPIPDVDDVLSLHRFGGTGDKRNDFCMSRDNHMLTVSITAMELSKGAGCMTYLDLKENKSHRSILEFNTSLSYASPVC